jgi:hypothetical protein
MTELNKAPIGIVQQYRKNEMPSMRIELISEDVHSCAEVMIYETSVLTVKLRGLICQFDDMDQVPINIFYRKKGA